MKQINYFLKFQRIILSVIIWLTFLNVSTFSQYEIISIEESSGFENSTFNLSSIIKYDFNYSYDLDETVIPEGSNSPITIPVEYLKNSNQQTLAVTGYTTRGSFDAAVTGNTDVLNFDALADLTPIPNGSSLNAGSNVGNVTFNYNIPNSQIITRNQFPTTSGNNFIGVQVNGLGEDDFVGGDSFTLNFASSMQGVGLYFLVSAGDPVASGDITLTTSGGNSSNNTTKNSGISVSGADVYFIGLRDPAGFTSVTLSSLNNGLLFEIDDIIVEVAAPSNTAPSIAVTDLNYTEGQNSGNPVQIDGSATASDAEDNWDGGSLTVQITANNEAGDEISVQDVGNITVNTGNGQISSSGTHFATATVNNATVTNGTTLTINFNSNATDTRIQELVRAVSYRTTSNNPGTSARTVAFTLSDDTAGTTDNATINVTAVDPELDVRNNADDADVTDGSTTITTALGTDFGSISAASGSQANTFRAENNGTEVLTLGADALAISGSGDFSITTDLTNSGTIVVSGVATFQITFDPSSVGLQTATVTIRSDDADEDPYTFLIQGTGTGPEIEVSVGGTDIPNGSMAADFGNVCASTGTIDVTYTVTNTGTANLTLTNPPTSSNGVFSVGNIGGTTLTPGNSTTFTVTFDPTAAGVITSTISIANNDSDENPFDFVVGGTGIQSTVTIATDTPDNQDEDLGNTIEFIFTRTGCTTTALTVNFSIGGTAVNVGAGDDYNVSFTGTGASGSYTEGNPNGTITIGAGQTIATLVVTPVSDMIVEANETVIVTITP